MCGPPRRGRMSLAVGETYGNGNPKIRFRPRSAFDAEPSTYKGSNTRPLGGRILSLPSPSVGFTYG
jgi:hypothetical protein